MLQSAEHKLQIAFLELEIDVRQNEKIAEMHHFMYHCWDIMVIPKDNVLYKFISYLDQTEYEDQKQLPNPTVIDTVCKKFDFKMGKTVVFTAYLA